MNVRDYGKLVAWAIERLRPKKSQRTFFSSLFKSSRYGKTPTARIAVIKHKGGTKYKLLRQSPVVKLSGALGHKQLFTLDRPLSVKKGQIVALTVPTWASNFASHISRHGNRWRGSRSRKNCSPQEQQHQRHQGICAQEQAAAEGGARCGGTAATPRLPASSTGPTTSEADQPGHTALSCLYPAGRANGRFGLAGREQRRPHESG